MKSFKHDLKLVKSAALTYKFCSSGCSKPTMPMECSEAENLGYHFERMLETFSTGLLDSNHFAKVSAYF